MSGKFYCWNEYGNGHTRDDATEIQAFDAESAAQEYVRRNFDRWDYPTNNEIVVESAADSTVCVVDVSVEAEPVFYASVRRAK